MVRYFFDVLFPGEKIAWVAAYADNYKAIETLLPLANALFPKQAPSDVYTYTSSVIRQYSPKTFSTLKKDLLDTPGRNVVLCWKRVDLGYTFDNREWRD